MLTPKFSLSQDADFMYIHIMAPYIKLTESECYINGDEFYFYSQPYYLRLHLPGKILEDDFSKSHYDVDTGQLTVRVAKETKGEVFEGLDMLTKLLTPKKVSSDNGEIEVIGSSCNEQSADINEDDESKREEEELDFDWFLEQKINDTQNSSLISGSSYGFACRKSNVLNVLVTGLPDLLDLKDPDNVPASERRKLREQQETEMFNCEHYLADLFEDKIILEIISQNYPELTGRLGKESVFTEMEKEKLLQLPRREYIVDDSDLKAVYLGLVDLVFAYAYTFRFTKGEFSVESDWTICKLSATLSWLDLFENIQDVIISCARRSLCFPLYRSWKLFHCVFNDVKTIFLTGKSQVLKCLLGIHKVLAASDIRYPLNDLYITDYCVWLQSVDPKKIEAVAKTLSDMKISKSDLGLRLDDMEEDAIKMMDECTENENQCVYDGKEETIERLTDAISDIVKISDAVVVDSDDDTSDNSGEDDDTSDDGGDTSDDEDTSNDEDTSDESGDDDTSDNNGSDSEDSVKAEKKEECDSQCKIRDESLVSDHHLADATENVSDKLIL